MNRIAAHSTLAFILLTTSASFASEIREFDLKTIERLGNELTRVSQTRDKGATTPVRKRAVQTAKTAVQDKLFDIRYDYVLLDDPDGKRFLVYALGRTNKSSDVVLSGHFRVTVSSNGEKVERVDALSHSLMVFDQDHPDLPKGTHPVGMYTTQLVSNKPVETLIYTSNLAKKPLVVGTPDGKIWFIENGKIRKSK